MGEHVNFLAIDIGASSGRVLHGRLQDGHFELTEIHRFSNTPVSVQNGLYWDILRLWHDIKHGLGLYARQVDEPLAGIGVDTWGVDYGLLDKSGQLLGNPRHYRDTRTVGKLEPMFQQVPKTEIYTQTGIQFLELNTLTQLYSAVSAQEPSLAYAETLLLIPDLLHYWLCGVRKSEYTIASTTQLLDAKTRTWSNELCQQMNINPAIFPELVQPGTVLGTLSDEVASETGLAADTPVVASACHDTASAVAGVPGLDENSVYISSGTWSLQGIETQEPVISDTMLELNFTNEGGVDGSIRLLKNIAGMWFLEECRRQWQRQGEHHSWEDLLSLAAAAKPLSCFIDPDHNDFNTPGDMPGRMATYCARSGQAPPTSVGEIVRSYLESLALKYRFVTEGLETVMNKRFDTVRIVGGGSQNTLLNQFCADACNKRVIAGPVEATALGNLMVQAVATGHIGSIQAGRELVARSVELTAFIPDSSPAWDNAYRQFTKLLNL